MFNNSKIVFESGKNGKKSLSEKVFSYRIPALLRTVKGTLIAGADRRHDHYNDWGNIDMVIRRSEDDGETWDNPIVVCDLQTNKNSLHPDFGSAFNIDMCLVQDDSTERIFAFYDMFTEQRGCFGLFDEDSIEIAYEEMEGHKYLTLYDTQTNSALNWTIRENGIVYDSENNPTNYWVIITSNKAPYHDLGDIYYQNQKVGNVFFHSNSENPFRIAKQMYIWMSYSDDDGKTWSCPKDITPQIKLPWMIFYGVGPGNGLTLHTGKRKGRLIIPMYSTNSTECLNGSQSSRIIYSDDHGFTWQSGEAVNDYRQVENKVIHSSTVNEEILQNTEATVVQLENGMVKLFMRNLTGHVQVATSLDDGETWQNKVENLTEINDVYVQMSAIQTIQEGREYVILVNADGPQRNNGVIHLFEVQVNGELRRINKRLFQEGKFAYNSIQQINSSEFGILYEHAFNDYNDYCLLFKKFNWQEIYKKGK